MEDFPPDYTEHNLPLVLLSGLGEGDGVGQAKKGFPRQESGTKLVIQTGDCEGERARHLLQHFVKRDGSISAWNASSLPGPVGSLKYRMQPIGRVGTLLACKEAQILWILITLLDVHSPSTQSSASRAVTIR